MEKVLTQPRQTAPTASGPSQIFTASIILANPPFNLTWTPADDPRWVYGLPPAGNANFAWIQHMLYSLEPHGRISLALANGALSSQSAGEGDIRRKIIEADLVEGIIAMPTQLFFSTSIPVSVWILSKDKHLKGQTVFVDARKLGHMVDRTHRVLSDEGVQKIAAAFEDPKDVKGFCAVVPTEDIAKQDYILTPGRYVGIEDQAEDNEPFEQKMSRLTSELSKLFAKSHELENAIQKNMKALGFEMEEGTA